jgi:GT2 family glycosyltransferase
LASASVAVVPSEGVVQTTGITVIIPTLERPSLKEAQRTMEAQTLKPDKILWMKGSGDPVSKIRKALLETDTEFVAIGDDDVSYPERWLEAMMDVMKTDEKIGFVGGTMLPMSALHPEQAGESEKRIAKVLGSFFGTTNMSQRVKIKQKVEPRDETNMVGCGLARTALVKEIFAHDQIIPSFHDTWMIYRIKSMGYRTMYCPQAYFYHATRTNLFSLSLQMLRCGSGRMGFFRTYPQEIPRKFYILFPMLFDIYLIAFFGLNWFNIVTVSGIPLILYVLVNLLVSYLQKDFKLTYYYATMHISYGLGELLGLFRSVTHWT